MRVFALSTVLALGAIALPQAASARYNSITVVSAPPELPGDRIEGVRNPGDLQVIRALAAAERGRYADGVSHLQEGAALGNARAMALLGQVHALGVGVQRDESAAFDWSRRGAEAGDARAMLALGIAYGRGLGVEADKDTAALWLRRAREANGELVRRDANAMLRKLGL